MASSSIIVRWPATKTYNLCYDMKGNKMLSRISSVLLAGVCFFNSLTMFGAEPVEVKEAEHWNNELLAEMELKPEHREVLTLGRQEVAYVVSKLAQFALGRLTSSVGVSKVDEAPTLARITNEVIHLELVAEKYGDFSVVTLHAAEAVYKNLEANKGLMEKLMQREVCKVDAIKLQRLMVELRERTQPKRFDELDRQVKDLDE